ncbi:hypothetical protein Pmani_033235 [Petrolisthes manimaculis]|uniref:Uncharacterized protein n=1 Tax=Petrolisthes manimaculis TaxID=1843537 RepID=A0AAE1TQV5_9EUCA|nr:hypothetical protein Pmani_033235 [Petrolisthes manimaculis]
MLQSNTITRTIQATSFSPEVLKSCIDIESVSFVVKFYGGEDEPNQPTNQAFRIRPNELGLWRESILCFGYSPPPPQA